MAFGYPLQESSSRQPIECAPESLRKIYSQTFHLIFHRDISVNIGLFDRFR